jgi:zinc-ribbon domain
VQASLSGRLSQGRPLNYIPEELKGLKTESAMYCPNCGKTNSSEQRFCRSCGLGLEKVVQSLSEQLTAADLDNSLVERQRKLDKWIKIVGGGTISIIVGGVLWGIIYEIIITKGEVLAGSLFLAFITGLILFALLMVYKESLVKTPGKERATRPVLPQREETARLLDETYPGQVSSVTEHTTEMLTVDEKKSKE